MVKLILKENQKKKRGKLLFLKSEMMLDKIC